MFGSKQCLHLTGALSSVEERPFRIREVEGSNPSVSTFFCWQYLSVAQLVEHVTVDVCDHRVAGSIPAAETFLFGIDASLAQSVERKALNLVVVGSSPTGGGFPHASAFL